MNKMVFSEEELKEIYRALEFRHRHYDELIANSRNIYVNTLLIRKRDLQEMLMARIGENSND